MFQTTYLITSRTTVTVFYKAFNHYFIKNNIETNDGSKFNEITKKIVRISLSLQINKVNNDDLRWYQTAKFVGMLFDSIHLILL